MAKISNNKWLERIISSVMAVVMIVSLLYCIADLTGRTTLLDDSTVPVEAASTTVKPDGTYIIPPKSTGSNLGTKENPFVVLEIVPNENMAQFGYLVGGQEPVDLEAIAAADLETRNTNPEAALKADLLKDYLTVRLDSSTELLTEFENIITSESFEFNKEEGGTSAILRYKDFFWNLVGTDNEYGVYKRLSGNTGNYDLKEIEKIEKVPVGYEYRKVTAADFDASGNLKFEISDLADPAEGETIGTVSYSAINMSGETVTKYADPTKDQIIWVQRNEGEGVYSDVVYDYVGSSNMYKDDNNALYSIDYKKLPGKTGNAEFVNTAKQYYKTNNVLDKNGDISIGKHIVPEWGGGTDIKFELGTYYAYFRLKNDDEKSNPLLSSYRIKYVTNEPVYRGWNRGDGTYNNFYAPSQPVDVRTSIFDASYRKTFASQADWQREKDKNITGYNYIKPGDEISKNEISGYITGNQGNLNAQGSALYNRVEQEISWNEYNNQVNNSSYTDRYVYYYTGRNWQNYVFYRVRYTYKNYIRTGQYYNGLEYNSNGKYLAIFEYTENGSGEYVLDGNPTSASGAGDANYGYTYNRVVTEKGTQYWADMSATNNGQYMKDAYALPQEVGTFTYYDDTARKNVTIGIGEYKKGIKLTTPIFVNEANKERYKDSDRGVNVEYATKIGNKNWDCYVLQTKTEDAKYYSYTMAANYGSGRYNWVPVSYSVSSAAAADTELLDGKTKKDFEDYLPVVINKNGKREESLDILAGEADTIYAVMADEPYYKGYEGHKDNLELFKKYALGLAYVDGDISKGEDSVGYDFAGWFYEPEGVNMFNDSTPITENTTLYAKWKVNYATSTLDDSLTVSFVKNVPDELLAGGKEEASVEVLNMPLQINDIGAGTRIVEPNAVPIMADYLFTGWYTDKECTEKFNFSETVNKNTVLYAGWTSMLDTSVSAGRRYSFTFNANTSALGIANTSFTVSGEAFNAVAGKPYEITDVGANGRIVSDTSSNFTAIKPADPTCSDNFGNDYIFGGWYLTSDCEVKFMFDTNIPATFTDRNPYKLDADGNRIQKTDSEGNLVVDGSGNPVYEEDPDIDIVLYARWIPKNKLPRYTVSFNTNEHRTAKSKCKPIASVYKNYGESLDAAAGEITYPTLEGNVASKLENYVVKVVTVTPKDFAKASNVDLIDRANLIVFNETCSNDMKNLWNSYKNTAIFGKVDGAGKPDYKLTETSFAQNDISWSVAQRVLTRITGVKYDAASRRNVSVATCPVIFDYSIYKNALANTTTGKNTKFTAKFKGGETYTSETVKGSNENVYKLYLLTQIANPVTLYNAYMKDSSAAKRIDSSSGNYINNDMAKSGTGVSDAKTYWTPYTLVPFNVINQGDWNANERQALAMIGFDVDIARSANNSAIKNRLFVFNSDSLNVVDGFTAPIMSAAGNEDIQKVVGTGKASFTTADVVYYLLNSSAIYENFDKDLSILEIEPGSAAHPQDYWFWYISRYVPNYTGTTNVKSVSSMEFVAMIDDLNSKYDAIYIGVDTSGIVKNSQIVPKNSLVIENSTVDRDIYVSGTQTFTYPVYVQKTVVKETKKIEIRSSYGLSESQKRSLRNQGYKEENAYSSKPILKVVNGNLEINQDALGTNPIGLNLKVTRSLTSGGANYSYYRYSNGMGGWNYIACNGQTRPENTILTITDSSAGTMGWTWKESASGSIGFDTTSRNVFVPGEIYLDSFFTKETVVREETLEWDLVNKIPAGTKISNTWVRIPKGSPTNTINTPYAYFHCGVNNPSTPNARLGSLSSSDANGTTIRNDDKLTNFVYSGNDLTYAKYKAMAEFVLAGFPIIFSRDMYDQAGNINSALVDSASWMYKFANEVNTNSNYVSFRENDTSHDADFIRALQKKTFNLRVTNRPVEYHDRTLPEYSGLSDSQIYINGNDIDNKSLAFDITIDSKASGYFALKLYIDTNADGKYNEADERLDSIEIVNKNTGRSVRYNRLEAGVPYRVNRIIEDYAGIIPWKLQVIDLDYKPGMANDELAWQETHVRDEVTGMSAVKVREKTKLYILQLQQTTVEFDWANQAHNGTVYFPTDKEKLDAYKKHGRNPVTSGNADTYFDYSTLNLGFTIDNQGWDGEDNRRSNVLKNAGWFYYYTDNLDEFDVHFCRVDLDTFKRVAKNPSDVPVGEEYDIKNNTKIGDVYWKDINMLVIGYADYYHDINDDDSLDLIDDFIHSGKTTLFTHDTTSSCNYSNETDYRSIQPGEYKFTAYKMTQRFREMLGLDRFGVLYNRGVYSRVESQYSTLGIDIEDINIANAADHKLDYDIVFKPGSNMEFDESNLYMGYDSSRRINLVLTQGMTDCSVIKNDLGLNGRTNQITKNNDGQIVAYPYYIPDKMEVSLTHNQYYQLNLEDDDVVVWYTLAPDKDTNSDRYKNHKDYYGVKNDAVNNYYIYNKGNITYTGVGHSSGLTHNEQKLFVNTMIAAYSATVTPTKPIVTNRDKSDNNGDTDYLYVNFDATISNNGAIGDDVVMQSESGVEYAAKEVDFVLKNYSIILNKRMTVHYYPVVYNKLDNGDVQRVVMYDYPMKLETKNINTGYPAVVDDMDKMKADASGVKGFFYDAPANKRYTSNKQRVHITAQSKASIVESLEEYSVMIPISDNYYTDVLHLPETYTYTDTSGVSRTVSLKESIKTQDEIMSNGGDESTAPEHSGVFFALDNKAKFEIEIQVAMRYGRDQTKNEPLVGTRGVVFMRRGMFTLE